VHETKLLSSLGYPLATYPLTGAVI
jgi:hypothetical protein